MEFHPLSRSMTRLLDKRKRDSTFRKLSNASSVAVDFSSNDFLSLSSSSALRDLFLQELNATPAFPLGSGGSRLLDGNSHYAEDLEREISEFHGAPAALLFNSGFDANVSVFSSIPQPGDVIIYDELIHASVHEGMRLSRAGNMLPFDHNSVLSFRRLLAATVEADALIRDGRRNVFVALESVYSMDGDLAPVLEVLEIVETLLPLGNGHVIVDEAHATGIFGANGRGLVSELGLEDRIFIRLHTFGKVLACSGAAVLCTAQVREYLINYARPMIYTTFMAFPSLAAIKSSYAFMQAGKMEPLREHLQLLSAQLDTGLRALPIGPRSPLRRLTPDVPRSPIFSLWTLQPRSLANFCQDAGFIVRPIVAPTVPVGAERVRICLHAGNTAVEVEGLVLRIKEWAAKEERPLSRL